MSTNQSLSIGSDNALWVRNVRADDEPEQLISDATVTFSLHTSEAAAVAGSGAISGSSGTASAVTGKPGTYRGVLDDAMTALLTAGTKYYIRVFIDAGSGRKDLRVLEYTARVRGST